jgi:hypothetical protein
LTIIKPDLHRCHTHDNLAAIARHTQDNPRRTGGFSGSLPTYFKSFPD